MITDSVKFAIVINYHGEEMVRLIIKYDKIWLGGRYAYITSNE